MGADPDCCGDYQKSLRTRRASMIDECTQDIDAVHNASKGFKDANPVKGMGQNKESEQ